MNKAKILSLLLIVSFTVLLAGWLYYQNQLRPVSIADKTNKDFVVEPGQSVQRISQNLKKAELIRSAWAFRILTQSSGMVTKLQAGSYRLSGSEDAKSIAKKLTAGFTDVWVTIPEGLRVEEIADKLAEKLPIDRQEFLNRAEEGYMFPDTYRLPQKIRGTEIAKIMRDNFNQRFDKTLQDQLARTGFSQQQLIILASLVEREVKFDQDRPIVAGILLSRWQKYLPLEVDATVQYALGFDKEERTYWRIKLTTDDLRVNSLYNTRRFVGFPPGPICSPGLASIKAVLNPKKTNYLYYLSDQSGKIYYAKTLEEHIANINKYL